LTRQALELWSGLEANLDAAVSLVEQLGGKNTGEVHTNAEGAWVVMADPEGTEFCLVALATG